MLIKEETYPIFQFTELYLPKRTLRSPNSAVFNRLKLSLREYERVFTDWRCENLDMIGTYRPYHFNGGEFGLYIYIEMLSMLILSILERSELSLRDSHALALDAVLAHGAFHYLFERYATLKDSAPQDKAELYPNYKRNVYRKVWGTADCLEETLANDFVFRAFPSWDRPQKTYLEFLFARQRSGYCQAVACDKTAIQDMYVRLEESLLDEVRTSDKETPCLSEFIERNIPFRLMGLPVYLVNDCKNPETFERIIDILFPQL
jgi:hypothetical protein